MEQNLFEYGLDEQEMEELLVLVSELAERYTGHESTSVSYERAQALMEAVLYCLAEYRKCDGAAVARTDETLRGQYREGLRLVAEKVEKIRKMFNALTDSFDDYCVVCLRDMVQKGIPEFLKRYDVTFAPQETFLTLDYPLLIDCSSMRGADVVYEYLCAIETEQRFLQRFGRGYVVSVLQRYDTQYEDMIENICRVILADTIGHAAAQKPMTAKEDGFQEADYVRSSKLFAWKGVSEIEKIIRKFICGISAQYYANDLKLVDYLCRDAGNLAVRIYTATQYGSLREVFR